MESRRSISKAGASAGARTGRRVNRQNKRLPQEVGRRRGEPKPRPKEARESEGCIGADVGELVGNSDPAEQRRPVLM